MSSQAWTTEDELEFIKGLGTHSPACTHIAKGKMLNGYMNSFHKRRVWNDIDRKAIQKVLVRSAYKARKR